MKKIKKKILIIKTLIITIVRQVIQNIKLFRILILKKLFLKIDKLIEMKQKKNENIVKQKISDISQNLGIDEHYLFPKQKKKSEQKNDFNKITGVNFPSHIKVTTEDLEKEIQ